MRLLRFSKSFILILVFPLSQIIAYSNLQAQNSNTDNKIYMLLFQKKYEEAIDILDQEIALDSTNADFYYLMGFAYANLNKYAKALYFFELAESFNPKHINNLVAIANANQRLGYFDRARKKYLKAISYDSTRSDIFDSLGKLYLRQKKYPEAGEVYQKLVKNDPGNSYYNLMQARCAAKMDSIDTAVTAYKRAQQIDSTNVEIKLELSRVLFNMEDFDSALVYANRGLAYNRNYQQLHRLKADILFAQKEYPAAILSYLDSSIHGDTSEDLHKKLGFCYYSIQAYDKAKTAFLKAAEKDKSDGMVSFYLGSCCKQLGEYEDAIKYFQQAVTQIIPSYMDYLYAELGHSFFARREFKNAIQCFRKAIEYSPDRDEYIYFLANVYDDYYADREVPLLYYKKVIRKDFDTEITEYAKARVKQLVQELHFNKN